ncbi:TetR/AcrR family transcriptional regulator [Neobacillus niacini]|uniref:TetR/AcrR family transcriptional regulator n=1 Tax=Neobacillus niacini TaxID=86668 RepID=UPI0007ABED6A|nr:TetR/AcrR family transcriptional regulator [Neobacillus niacini]MEC1521276.1 TetR/AcrR family transcriptional regulator [Neobacillus niacini]
MTTDEKILKVAIDMIAKKGFKGATTKQIAEKAAVSEMTLFRHFPSKKKILEAAIDRYYYSFQMKELFEHKLIWNLEKDLLMIAETYHTIMKKNKNVIKIAIQEGHNVPGLLEQVNKHPRQLKELIEKYLEEMHKRNHIKDCDYELTAMNFLYMSYGLFISRSFVSGEIITSLSEEDVIKGSVQVFIDHLTPSEVNEKV